ncbi:MAG: hypothetical protein GTN82_14645, partial [Candidatus Aminicenantes bacterium]|nr:hypothetical protein [Candidatus Aminicenantes bacterium]NIR06655.1 hypothetical protein [Candidatus Aminicenantes bacterium]
MKQNAYARVFIFMFVILVLLVVNCGKSGDNTTGNKVAEKLAQHLNKFTDFEFRTELEHSIVEPLKNNRYRVTFKNSSFTIDLAPAIEFLWKRFSSEEFPYKGLFTFHIDEMILLYDPPQKKLKWEFEKGFTVCCDFPEFEKDKDGSSLWDIKIKRLHVFAESITHRNLDISMLLTTRETNLSEVLRDFGSEDPQASESIVENLKVEINGVVKNKNNLSIGLEIEKVGNTWKRVEDRDVSLYLSKKDAPVPDLSKTLKKGLAITDGDLDFRRVKVSIKLNGSEWGGGALDRFSWAVFFKPDETGDAFKYGTGFDIKNLKLSIPGNKKIELLSNIKECRISYSLEHLSPEAALAAIDLMKIFFQLGDSADNPKIRSLLMMHLTKFFTESLKSKVGVKFSISPFKHYFGELFVEANIASPPRKTQLLVKISKIDEILKKLEDSHVLSPTVLKSISETVEYLVVRHENGDA